MIAEKEGITAAREAAQKVLSELLLSHPCDMEIEDIGWVRGVLVKDDELTGSEGRLIKMGERGIVTVRSGIPESGRRRFTIAHELGHFELHKTNDQMDVCTEADIQDDHNAKPEELEANAFASELLLPSALMRRRCAEMEPSWANIKQLAQEFQTTITLTAMRLVAVTNHQLALFHCHKGQIRWFRASESFRYRLETGIPVDQRSYAYGYFAAGKVLRGAVPVEAWLKSMRINPTIEIIEDCFPLPRYDAVLSLVWARER